MQTNPPSRQHHYQLLKRGLAVAFFLLVAWLIYRYGRTLDWQQIWRSVQQIDRSTLLLAAACSIGSYAVYACVDLFARHALRLQVSKAKAMAIAFVCYAFNLNFGSWVGSIGFRYRLYSRIGLDAEQVTRVVGMSLVTNWSGYFLLAGVAFAFNFVKPPAGWEIGRLGLTIAGVALLATLVLYIGASALAKRRSWTIRGRELSLPSAGFATLQVLVSSLNWLLIAGILYVLLRQHVDFPLVLGVFLLAAIAGAATHVPAGLGVTEAVFFAVLGSRVPHAELFAALLTYRALYYLMPLCAAIPVYFLLEAQGRSHKLDAENDAAEHPEETAAAIPQQQRSAQT
ncbi:lysylphosphatidylglycerol synthase domain-containing protein [Nevskia ramosa]|uniref:lysylphosphatidylglycerol synthase domain-containing protein n=1 Tax=Nevskia ramosa TaxID=64002 RepID=UPI0003B77835|nr:lysylphosphatidylglycerol synthase domain-containing protein [Nevskia ramosa]